MRLRNQATWDRWLRVVVGVLMLAAGFSGLVSTLVSAVLKVFAFVPLVTGLLGWCPFYELAGFRTFRRRLGRDSGRPRP